MMAAAAVMAAAATRFAAAHPESVRCTCFLTFHCPSLTFKFAVRHAGHLHCVFTGRRVFRGGQRQGDAHTLVGKGLEGLKSHGKLTVDADAAAGPAHSVAAQGNVLLYSINHYPSA